MAQRTGLRQSIPSTCSDRTSGSSTILVRPEVWYEWSSDGPAYNSSTKDQIRFCVRCDSFLAGAHAIANHFACHSV